MTTPVTFELAKLLKEKEYKDRNALGTVRLSEPKYYDPNGLIHSIKDAFEEKNYKIENCFNAPTIAEVVMWLYEKHGFWISVGGDCDYKFKFEIHKWNWYELEKTYRLGHVILGESFWDTSSKIFNSPTEAYEAAIEYTLNNLI